jgi:hypothetical protein
LKDVLALSTTITRSEVLTNANLAVADFARTCEDVRIFAEIARTENRQPDVRYYEDCLGHIKTVFEAEGLRFIEPA